MGFHLEWLYFCIQLYLIGMIIASHRWDAQPAFVILSIVDWIHTIIVVIISHLLLEHIIGFLPNWRLVDKGKAITLQILSIGVLLILDLRIPLLRVLVNLHFEIGWGGQLHSPVWVEGRYLIAFNSVKVGRVGSLGILIWLLLLFDLPLLGLHFLDFDTNRRFLRDKSTERYRKGTSLEQSSINVTK